eukprot:3098613-Karenia_brevis.AAC.1
MLRAIPSFQIGFDFGWAAFDTRKLISMRSAIGQANHTNDRGVFANDRAGRKLGLAVSDAFGPTQIARA